ncbi:ubiquinol-cytochrome c reductase complex assembly factor 6-like [Glandiceps talaboti]
MPAGVPWSQYLKFLTAGLLTMMAGSQLVHVIYKPDMSIPGESTLEDNAQKSNNNAESPTPDDNAK